MTDVLTAVSLFAGVGGFDLAAERAGLKVVAAVEINDQARGVIADRFPDTALFTDVREVTADAIRAAGFVPERGIVIGGFPCQDLSVAGLRAGLGGARSGLFWEIVRLAYALRPRWIVLENVPGLLSAVCPCPGTGEHDGCDGPHQAKGGACDGRCMEEHGGAMGAVLGALAELGYGFAYRVLDAQHFGVPQRRRRVFIVGCLGDPAGPVEVLLEPESGARNPAPRGEARQGASAGVVVSTLQGGGKRGCRIDAEGVSPPVTSKWAKGTGGPAGDEAQNLIAFDAAQITAVQLAAAVRRLTPLECERLQGFPDGWTATSNGRQQADAPRYRQLGNAVAVPVPLWIFRRLVAVEAQR